MPLPRRTIWESITADGPQEYTDGYGQTRQMYESPIISGIRKYIVQPIKKIDRKLNPTEEDYEKMGMKKPYTGLGVVGLLNPESSLKMIELSKEVGPVEAFLNGENFMNSSIKTQNALMSALKRRIKISPKEFQIANRNQKNALEIENELRNTLSKKRDLPFGMYTDANGKIRMVPGDVEEKSRFLYYLDQGAIDPTTVGISRSMSKGESLNGWIQQTAGSPVMMGGEGSQWLVTPYSLAESPAVGDFYFVGDNASLLKNRAAKLSDIRRDKLGELQSAFNSGDIETAADKLSDLIKLPELQDDFLIQRLKQAINVSRNNIPKGLNLGVGSKNSEIARMARLPFKGDMPVIEPGQIDFSNQRFRVFTGDENVLGSIIGKYFSPKGSIIEEFPVQLDTWNTMSKLSNNAVNQKYVNIKTILENKFGKDASILKSGSFRTNNIFPEYLKMHQSSSNPLIMKIKANDFHGAQSIYGNPNLIGVGQKDISKLLRIDRGAIGLKQGGIVKAQNGWVLDKWQKAYNSKFGKGLRDFLYGQDRDLSDEEYLKKYGYNKPVGGIGVLGALVAPEWEGLEAPVVAENFGRAGYIKATPWTARLKYTKPTNPSGFPKTQQLSNLDKFLQKSVQEQNDIVRYWNGERFSNLQQLQRNPQQYKLFQHWLSKQ